MIQAYFPASGSELLVRKTNSQLLQNNIQDNVRVAEAQ